MRLWLILVLVPFSLAAPWHRPATQLPSRPSSDPASSAATVGKVRLEVASKPSRASLQQPIGSAAARPARPQRQRRRMYGSRGGVPDWEVDARFPSDVFTFVRVKYRSADRYDEFGWRQGPGYRWDTDYPSSDLNFSFRLQQLTSLKVNPDPIYLELTDDELFDYPFLYMIEPGSGQWTLSQREAENLRRYLLNGGFLMVDDFWGEREWRVFERQIRRVFPKRAIVDLPLEHPIFHWVYDLKEKPQVPSIQTWLRRGVTWERYDAREPHYRAIFDDNDRMMVMICHNTDLGDGWEREGENEEYFHRFSEKLSYPMGINIVVYAMTH